MNIVILDGYSVNPGDMSWAELEQFGEVTVYDRTSQSEVAERCRGAEIVITNKTPLSASELRAMPDCKLVSILATGYNIIDTEAARECGITVCNVPGYSTSSVAQNTIALLLAITNHVESYAAENRAGRWSRCKDFCYWDHRLTELDGKLIGIVGYGNIGKRVARIASAMGMRVGVYSSKSREELPEVIKMSLEDLFRESDVVSLHCPLTPDTAGLVNKERLSMMKRSAILINTARGGLVDEQALADALNSGRIYAAGLDVMGTEPPSDDNPLLGARNCFVTPHISWATVEARERLVAITVENISAYCKGEIINAVN